MLSIDSLPRDQLIRVSDLPALTGLSRMTIHNFVTKGKRAASGELIKLERIKTEVGWCTTKAMLERFRLRLAQF